MPKVKPITQEIFCFLVSAAKVGCKRKGAIVKVLKTNLQEFRKRAGFKSAREFAEYMNIPVGTYTNYEQGKANMSLVQAWEFADELNCTLDELAGRKVESLTDEERKMVEGYRVADAVQKRRMLNAAQLEIEMAEESALEKKTAI